LSFIEFPSLQLISDVDGGEIATIATYNLPHLTSSQVFALRRLRSDSLNWNCSSEQLRDYVAATSIVTFFRRKWLVRFPKLQPPSVCIWWSTKR